MPSETRPRRISPRLILVGGLVVYLLGDFALHGPVAHRVALLRPESPESIAKARAEGAVALVFDRPIHRSQLDRVVQEQACDRRQALDQLIDEELLRRELRESEDGRKIAASKEETDEALRRFRLKFESPESMASALKAEGFANEAALRDRLELTLRLEKLITSRTAANSQVSEAEAREWFGKHATDLATPERLQARQVFLATLDREPAEARQKLDAALADLTAGKKDFAALVAELSEDEGSKVRGGDLGWMTRERLPADFVLPLFALEPGKPSLIRSKLGWHLVEVTARKPAAPAEFESLKPEILAGLVTKRKAAAIARFRQQLRQSAVGHLRVFEDA